MKILIISILTLLSVNSFAEEANLYCQGELVDTEKVANYDINYTYELYSNNCGVEGETCFTGADSEAYILLNVLNKTMYEYDDEVSIIGAYFQTQNSDTIVLKYKELGQYNETIIERCK